MKLLIVFLSALVLVAQGNVLSSDEAAAGYAVVDGQEADRVGSQILFAEEAEPAGFPQDPEAVPGYFLLGLRDCSKGIPWPRNIKGEEGTLWVSKLVSALEAGVDIPIVARACNGGACAILCHRFGFKYGRCISVNICQCRNR